jgi:hypothetical protein
MNPISIKIPVLIVKTTHHLYLILLLKSLLINSHSLKVILEMNIGFIFTIDLMNRMVVFHSLILKVLFEDSVYKKANLRLKFIIKDLQ